MDILIGLAWIFAALLVAFFIYFFLIPYFKRIRMYIRAYLLMRKIIKDAKKKKQSPESIKNLEEIAEGIKQLIFKDKP